MPKSRIIKPIPPKSEQEELYDAVFGPNEEMSEDLADDILATYAVTGQMLVDKFKARLQERIKEIHDQTGEIPAPLEATMRNVRQYERERIPRTVGADEWVSEIFGAALLPSSHASPLFSFRTSSTGEISENDRDILSRLMLELEEADQ